MSGTAGESDRARPAGVGPETREALVRVGHARRFVDGSLVLLEGDTVDDVYVVLEGALRVYRASLQGREQTMIYLHPGDLLNLPAAFADGWSVPASVVALGTTRLVVVRAAALRGLVQTSPAVALDLLRVLAERTEHLGSLVYGISLLSVRARLARFLLEEVARPEATPTRWTHAQIAARIGTVRVVVSRTLSALAEEGLVRMNRQRIEVVDAPALRQVAELGDEG